PNTTAAHASASAQPYCSSMNPPPEWEPDQKCPATMAQPGRPTNPGACPGPARGQAGPPGNVAARSAGRERLAREVDRFVPGAHHVVLDPDAAKRAQRLDPGPVHAGFAPGRTQVVEQHVDEVDARLDGHHEAGFQGAG